MESVTIVALHDKGQTMCRSRPLTSTERICLRTVLCMLDFDESRLPPPSEPQSTHLPWPWLTTRPCYI